MLSELAPCCPPPPPRGWPGWVLRCCAGPGAAGVHPIFDCAFKAPVFAEQDIAVVWRVAEVEASTRRGGFIGHLDGEARVGGRACVVGRGTVLVERAALPTT